MTTKVAIVTGGTSGIGRATACALAAAGYAVYALGRTAPAREHVTPVAGCVAFRAADVRHSHTLRPVLREAAEVGDLAVLVNAAGVITPGLTTNVEAASITEQFNVNVIGAITVSRLFVEAKVEQLQGRLMRGEHDKITRPAVVMVASTSGMRPSPGWAAYGASKAAMINYGQSLAAENPELNVITVAPGRTATRLRRAIAPLEDQATIQQPEDVAAEIVALLAAANAQADRSFAGSPIVISRTGAVAHVG